MLVMVSFSLVVPNMILQFQKTKSHFSFSCILTVLLKGGLGVGNKSRSNSVHTLCVLAKHDKIKNSFISWRELITRARIQIEYEWTRVLLHALTFNCYKRNCSWGLIEYSEVPILNVSWNPTTLLSLILTTILSYMKRVCTFNISSWLP